MSPRQAPHAAAKPIGSVQKVTCVSFRTCGHAAVREAEWCADGSGFDEVAAAVLHRAEGLTAGHPQPFIREVLLPRLADVGPWDDEVVGNGSLDLGYTCPDMNPCGKDRSPSQNGGKSIFRRFPEVWVATADELIQIAIENPGAGLEQ